MKFSKIQGDFTNRKVILSIKNTEMLTKKGVAKSFHLIGRDLTKIAKKGILDKKKKTGRVYTIYKGGRLIKHQASAAGEYPANLSGALKNSIGYIGANSLNRLEFGAGKESGRVNYAKFLEKGTEKMGARPFLKMAIKSNFRNIENYIGNSVISELKI